jgi:hypothetical protein
LEVAAGLAGGAPGVSAVLEIDGEIVLILLSNFDEPSAEDIARALMPELVRSLR